MTTWIVHIATAPHAALASGQQKARDIQAALTLNAGRTGEPGIDPLVTLADGGLLIRQAFPMVTPTQAAQMAAENLRRWVRPNDIVRIEAITHDAWLAKDPS